MQRIEEDNLERAKSALDRVREVAKEPDLRKRPKLCADYLNAVEAFPFTVRTLGLGQALAWLRATGAKDDRPGHERLYRDLHYWLCADRESRSYPAATDLLDAIMANGQSNYRAALIETEAYFAWLKPFAQALLSKPEKPQPTE